MVRGPYASGMMTAELRAEEDHLEAAIAALRRELGVAESALSARMHGPRPRPRGFGAGLAVGGALVFVGVLGFVVAMFVAWARFMSHMG
jgi:hypothetical protein